MSLSLRSLCAIRSPHNNFFLTLNDNSVLIFLRKFVFVFKKIAHTHFLYIHCKSTLRLLNKVLENVIFGFLITFHSRELATVLIKTFINLLLCILSSIPLKLGNNPHRVTMKSDNSKFLRFQKNQNKKSNSVIITTQSVKSCWNISLFVQLLIFIIILLFIIYLICSISAPKVDMKSNLVFEYVNATMNAIVRVTQVQVIESKGRMKALISFLK